MLAAVASSSSVLISEPCPAKEDSGESGSDSDGDDTDEVDKVEVGEREMQGSLRQVIQSGGDKTSDVAPAGERHRTLYQRRKSRR